MSKILVVLCLCSSAVAFSQDVNVLNSIADIAVFKNIKTSAINISDTLRGGNFNLYTGSNPVDNGLIFKDQTGRKWLRQNADAVDIRWFGAVPGGADNRQKILDAIASAKRNLTKIKIYIPGTSDDQYYEVSDSIDVTDMVEIYGDGQSSKLRFAAHKSGLRFKYPGAFYSYVHDLRIVGGADLSGNLSAAQNDRHGIIFKVPVRFENVWAQYFDGCGFYGSNRYDPIDMGNSNTATFYRCHAFGNLLHGFYFSGGDANAMTINNCDASNNGGVGFYDRSFLGNNYTDIHAATNGSPEIPYQRGLVKNGGTVYACIKDDTKGQAPPNTMYWQDIGKQWLGYSYVKDYDRTKMYHAVAPWILENPNQYSTMKGCYAEGDQAPGYIDYGCIDLNSRAPYRNASPTRIYASLGNIRSNTYIASDIGIVAPWLFAGNLSSYTDPYLWYKNSTGSVVGSTDKSAMVDLWDKKVRTGSLYTTSTSMNILTQAGKNLLIYTNNNTTDPRMVVTENAIGVGTSTPARSAELDVSSTTKGFLPPRMTAIQASAITRPVEGLMIYVTDTNVTFTRKGWWGYNGSSWERLNN